MHNSTFFNIFAIVIRKQTIMVKNFLFVLASFSMLFTSCVTTMSAQDDIYDNEPTITEVQNKVSMEVVITYGTPYIIDGLVQYYIYNNMYYYPYYYRNYLYYRAYARPLLTYPRHWRPLPRNYWFRNGRFHKPNRFDNRRHGNTIRHRPTQHTRPIGRPSSTRMTPTNPSPRNDRQQFGRPSTPRGQGTPHNSNRGNFGGRR